MAEFSKSPASWNIIVEPMTSNVVIPEVDVLIFVVLSKAEKHVRYGERVGTREYEYVTL
jgi:hypothetical protein